jgi:hypothetical protein
MKTHIKFGLIGLLGASLIAGNALADGSYGAAQRALMRQHKMMTPAGEDSMRYLIGTWEDLDNKEQLQKMQNAAKAAVEQARADAEAQAKTRAEVKSLPERKKSPLELLDDKTVFTINRWEDNGDGVVVYEEFRGYKDTFDYGEEVRIIIKNNDDRIRSFKEIIVCPGGGPTITRNFNTLPPGKIFGTHPTLWEDEFKNIILAGGIGKYNVEIHDAVTEELVDSHSFTIKPKPGLENFVVRNDIALCVCSQIIDVNKNRVYDPKDCIGIRDTFVEGEQISIYFRNLSKESRNLAFAVISPKKDVWGKNLPDFSAEFSLGLLGSGSSLWESTLRDYLAKNGPGEYIVAVTDTNMSPLARTKFTIIPKD